jgi:hypothetical protein
MLNDEIFNRINRLSDGDFSIKELFQPFEWSRYPLQERRGAGRSSATKIKKGLWNKDGWIIEPLPDTSPQRYRKRRETPASSRERVFLNEISGIEQTNVHDLIRILEATGKWLEVVDKPPNKTKNAE